MPHPLAPAGGGGRARRLAAIALSVARRLGPVGPALLFAAGLPLAGVILLAAPLAAAAPYLREAGATGAALFAIGAGLLAGLSIVPMHLLAILAGWTFALPTGVVAVGIGLVCAAALGYHASAALAKRRVIDLLDDHPRGAIVRRALVEGGTGRAAMVVGLLRLSPLMPFAATNLAMAALHVPFGAFMLGTVAGMIPRVVGGVIVGAGLTQIDPSAPAGSWPALLGIVATCVVIVVIGRVANRALAGLEKRRPADAGHRPPVAADAAAALRQAERPREGAGPS